MKIGNAADVPKLDVPRVADARGSVAGKAAVSSDEPVGKVEPVDRTGDRIELSPAGKSALAEPMPVRTDKVAQVRAAIERGEFPVNPTKVAERMISQAVALVNLIVPAAPGASDDAGQSHDAAGAVGRSNGSDA